MNNSIILIFLALMSISLSWAEELTVAKTKWIEDCLEQIESQGAENIPYTKVTGSNKKDNSEFGT